MEKRPRVSVKIILRHKDEVLMLKYKDGANSFPGGGLEWGESIMEALKRELKEELNYSLNEKPEFFSIYNFISPDKKRHSVVLHYIYFLKERPAFPSLSLDGAKVLWLTKEDLSSYIKNQDFINQVFKYKKK